MKMFIKLLGLITSVLIFAAIFTACEGNVSDGNVADNTGETAATDSVSEALENGMNGLENGVKNAVDGIGDSLEAAKTKVADALGMNDGVTEEKIKEAVDFIEKHIDDDIGTVGRDVREKFVYYAEYLRQAGEKASGDNEIKTLGAKCSELVNKLTSDGNADISGIRREIRDSLDKIKADKDRIIKDLADSYSK